MAFNARSTLIPALLTSTDRKSTRLNSSHRCTSYAVLCLKKEDESGGGSEPREDNRLTGIHQDLARRAEAHKPIRFAVVGAGQMGTDIVSQVYCMRGIDVAAIADLDLSRAT